MYCYASKISAPIFLAMLSISGAGYCRNDYGASELGADYAFLSLMTLTPDFAAANYTIDNNDGSSVDVAITRLPYHVPLMESDSSKLQLEMSLAYQRTKEVILTFPELGETIDAEWNTYGADIGLLYDHKLTQHLFFTPSLRFGVTRMKNSANYNGVLTNIIKEEFDGTLFNWKTNASMVNLGLGLDYRWKLRGRPSSLAANAYHMTVDSFSESNEAVKFRENANLLSIKADMIFPTELTLSGERVDFIALLGINDFWGENKRTLGYTSSYQAGGGVEYPVTFGADKYGYIRVSGQILWADNMNGWLFSIGYQPN